MAMPTLPKVSTKLSPIYSSVNIFNWNKMHVFVGVHVKEVTEEVTYPVMR